MTILQKKIWRPISLCFQGQVCATDIFILQLDGFIILVFFSTKGAFTSAINYYRANLSYFPKNERKRAIGDGENGMFVMGQLDKYISQESVILMSQYYPKLRVEVALNANHFLQQDAPQAVNDIIRDFLGKVPVATPQQ